MAPNPFELAAAEWSKPDFSRDVAAWAADRLDVHLWSLPEQIAQLTQTRKRTAVPACHSSSKSFSAAVLACHHLDTHVVGEARIITTAPSQAQVQGVLWSEINRLYDRAKAVAAERTARGEVTAGLPGRVNQMNWWIGNWQAGIGRKPSDYKPEQFAGFHALHPFIILDEADGLPDTMWDGVEALMTSRYAKMLAIANPLDPLSRFASMLSLAETQGDDGEWAVLRIPYNLTPNFTGETVPQVIADSLINPEWVEARRIEWGGRAAIENPSFQPDHPFWYGRVLAVHPPEAAHTIMRINSILAASMANDTPVRGLRVMGLDIAGSEKGDMTVARERVGRHVMRKWTIQTEDDDKIEDFAVERAQLMQAERIVMDATGLGFGFQGRLRRRLPGVSIIPVNFGAGSDAVHDDGSKKYKNLRAELWWRGRELAEAGELDLSKAEDLEYLQFELVAARYRPDVLSNKRVVQVESKDEIRKRIGRSPDDADATLLSLHEAKGAGIMRVSSGKNRTLPTGAAVLVRPR